MRFLSGITFLTLTSGIAAQPSKQTQARPPAFFLAGDSTTAKQTAGGGGWGDGFLNTTLHNGAYGKNFGHNGATTVSFRAGGDWANVLNAAKGALQVARPYITIQFGHNDQKPANNISMADLTANLVTFVREVRAVNATPILVTSITRRRFNNATGLVVENLADVTAAAKEAARQSGADLIDLNAASTKYVNAIGATNAATYNLNPTDFTHLNDQGSVVFGSLVAMLIDGRLPELKHWVEPMNSIEKALSKGQYIFP